jgi:DNA-binding transcriptional ArsR family regulator
LKNSKEITGNALRTYLYLVTHGPSELREVQRGVGLSTPSLASYHLSRLVEAGYVEQDKEGRYVASKEASTEILEGYIRVGTALVPQFLFFAVLFTMLIVFFSIEALLYSGFTIYLVVVSLAVVALLWYESLRLWRRLVVDSNRKMPSP